MNNEKTAPSKNFIYFFKVLLLLLLIILLSRAILNNQHPTNPTSQSQDPSDSPEKRQAFANLELTSSSGDKVKLSSFPSSVKIVSFWATWCEPCMEELPHFAKLSKESSIQIIAINQDDDEARDEVLALWKKLNMPFPTYFDLDHKLADQLKVEVLPTNFILDKKGRLAFSVQGSIDWHGSELKAPLQELLNEP